MAWAEDSTVGSAWALALSRSLGASWGLSSMAASAGDRVSELIVEITVEMAMVTASLPSNCARRV